MSTSCLQAMINQTLFSSAVLASSFAAKSFDYMGLRQASQPRAQLQSTASCLAVFAAGLPSGLSVSLEANGALSSTLSCSPPTTYTKAGSITYRLTVPTTCLAAAKTRRKKGRRGGSGGDDEIPDGDDGGSGGFGGSGGDDFGNGDNWWEEDDSQGRPRLVLQDIVLLWSIFCAFCFCHTLQHMVRQSGPRPPSGVLAAISASRATSMKDAAA